MSESSQKIGPCQITDCSEYGRTLAWFAGSPLMYCAKHRKYGQSVIQTFLDDVFNYKKSKLYDLAKQEMFFGGEKILDEQNERRLGSWFQKKVYRKYITSIGSFAIERETFRYTEVLQPIEEREGVSGSPTQEVKRE